MKQIVTAMLLLAGLSAFGQCKYKVNKIDEITGNIKKRTKEVFITGNIPAFGLELSQNGLKKYIVFQVYTSTIQSIDINSKVTLKSVRGQVFELHNTFETVSYAHPSGWRTPFYIEFDHETKQILQQNIMNFARFETRDMIIDKKINKKGADRINKIMPCI